MFVDSAKGIHHAAPSPPPEDGGSPYKDRASLLRAAIKAPMYSVGIMPILVSAAAVFATTGQADMLRTLGLCLSSILIIAWLNLSNDYFDSLTGVDTHKYESWVNITRSPRTIFVTAHASLLAGAGMLFWLLSQSPAIASKMLYAAICCGYLYQGPPFRLSYQGLGEALCFVAFGPLAVNAFYLAQGAPALSTQSCILSVLVGVSTSAILFCSHFHQVKGDLAAGKRSPIVRLGTETGAQVLKVTVGLVHVGLLATSLLGYLPLTCWTSAMVAYGSANAMVSLAEKNAHDPEALRPLKLLATRWHILFCTMLCLGLVLKRAMLT